MPNMSHPSGLPGRRDATNAPTPAKIRRAGRNGRTLDASCAARLSQAAPAKTAALDANRLQAAGSPFECSSNPLQGSNGQAAEDGGPTTRLGIDLDVAPQSAQPVGHSL